MAGELPLLDDLGLPAAALFFRFKQYMKRNIAPTAKTPMMPTAMPTVAPVESPPLVDDATSAWLAPDEGVAVTVLMTPPIVTVWTVGVGVGDSPSLGYTLVSMAHRRIPKACAQQASHEKKQDPWHTLCVLIKLSRTEESGVFTSGFKVTVTWTVLCVISVSVVITKA